jgi:hypothetical protein
VWQRPAAAAPGWPGKSARSIGDKCGACGKISGFIYFGASMPHLVLDIALSAERLRAVYQGRANRILLESRDGRRVSLPAHHIRPFMTHDGVYGSFELEFSPQGELLSLRRLD